MHTHTHRATLSTLIHQPLSANHKMRFREKKTFDANIYSRKKETERVRVGRNKRQEKKEKTKKDLLINAF